jgi:hypothetical protein
MEAVCSSEMSTFKHVTATGGKLVLGEQSQSKAENLYVKESNALDIQSKIKTQTMHK